LRIGFDARLINSLGIGRYISGLLPPLARLLGENLVIFTPATQLAFARALVGAEPTLVISNSAPYRLGEQSSLLASLLRHRLDLVHFPHYSLPLAYPRHYVVTIHDLFSFRYPEIHSGPVPRLINQVLLQNAIRRASAIITPSRSTADDVAQRFPGAERRISAIAEAASERFSPIRDLQAEATWQRYFGIRPPYFLYLGQWKPYKNVALVIEAFAAVLRQRPDVQLVVAGSDPRYPEITAAARRLPPGSVVLPGHLPDDAIPDLYRGSAAVVLASRAEGFGLPVLEAMASGVFVVCSNLPVLHEIADGIALFCDADSADSFANGMLEALAMPRAGDRIRRGVERAHQFSWSTAAQMTVAIYERVVRPETTRS
jgi:glycosyltransferase involved in cell wall biosynthesis